MALPKEYNFDYYAGDLYQLVLYAKNDDGSQYDLTDHSGLLTVSTERGNPATDIFSASASISTSPSRIVMTISPYNGSLLTGASYVYDLEISENSNPEDIYTFVTGRINVQQGVTPYNEPYYTTVDAGNPFGIVADVIINGGIPTSVFYSIFDGGTP